VLVAVTLEITVLCRPVTLAGALNLQIIVLIKLVVRYFLNSASLAKRVHRMCR